MNTSEIWFFIFHHKGVSFSGNTKGNMALLIAENCQGDTIYVLIMSIFCHINMTSG